MKFLKNAVSLIRLKLGLYKRLVIGQWEYWKL